MGLWGECSVGCVGLGCGGLPLLPSIEVHVEVVGERECGDCEDCPQEVFPVFLLFHTVCVFGRLRVLV